MSANATRRGLPQAEQRRRAILEATLRVIAAGGVEAVTHRRVAEEAGVSLSSTTYYFATREAIILEAFRHYIAADEPRGPERPLRTIEEGIEFLTAWAARAVQDPARLLAEYELILYAARDRRLGHQFAAWQRSLEMELAEGLEGLGATRPLEAARTIAAIIRAFELEKLARPELALEDLRRRLELVFPALVPTRPATRSQRSPRFRRSRRSDPKEASR